MELKELETKIQKIFNNDDLQVCGNYRKEPYICVYNSLYTINIMSFLLDNEKNVRVRDYHCKFYVNDDCVV